MGLYDVLLYKQRCIMAILAVVIFGSLRGRSWQDIAFFTKSNWAAFDVWTHWISLTGSEYAESNYFLLF